MSALSKWAVVVAMLLVLFTLASSVPVLARTDSPPLENLARVRAPDAPLPLNHFWCYQVASSQPVNEKVKLQDQFSSRPRRALVNDPNRLCNPVRKKHGDKTTEILNPRDHLVVYNIGKHDGDPKRAVQVRNQFGVAQLAVYFPAEVLMVPSRKLPHRKPRDTDHFKCYYVQGQPENETVGLRDQFQETPATVVLQPVWLCNPVRKYHKDKWTEIRYPEAHLVCYALSPKDFTKIVTTINQFRREELTVLYSDLLCVPSRKKVLD